ncbi:helix-turn-helix transcriptional regulator [Longimicrobium sp.]|jgi:transcriptional regulator with XRE-family HTH domain|uniref:helix-turn-helix domain-containing protein n=1 Tax=Longimicrobium sp. TaxID=2029185 RepID=UPI002F91F0B8
MAALPTGEQIGRLINRIRGARTQKEFAVALGRPGSQAQVSKWERGEVAPDPDTLVAVAQLGGMSSLAEFYEAAEAVDDDEDAPAERFIRALSVEGVVDVYGSVGVPTADLIAAVYAYAERHGFTQRQMRKLDRWRDDYRKATGESQQDATHATDTARRTADASRR